MKIFFDLLPVVLFFVAYKMYDIYVATGVILVACFLQLLVMWVVKRRVEKVYLWTFVAVLVLGGPRLSREIPCSSSGSRPS